MTGKLFSATAIVGCLAFAASPASATNNLVVNGDFSAGNTGFATGYTLTTMTPQLFQNGVHGIYAVIPIGSVAGQAQYGDWTNVTTDPSGGNGNVFVADGATDPNTIVWQQTVNVATNTHYVFSFDAAEISNACCSNAFFVPTVNSNSGAGASLTGGWQQYTFDWYSGANTTATLSLTDTNTSGGFNDFVLTDISMSGGVPEPSTWAMMMLGFMGLGLTAYRRATQRDREACSVA